MANSSLSLVSLDFDALKTNFKTYLKSQSVFRDYDFEGSNINVLLDVLSYNSYLNSFYLNMAVSEGFLDSAQMMSSVISHAKELNYTPRSARSAKALVNLAITVNSGTTKTIEIPKGTQFSGQNANGSYVYTTAETHILTSTSTAFSIANLAIYEGTYINETQTFDNSIENQKFILSNKNVDTTSISVTVLENDGLNVFDYKQATNLYGLTNTSPAYFVQCTLEGYYEVVFGDGVFGRTPQNNSTVLITYRITNGLDGNGVASFTTDRDIGAFNNVQATVRVTTVSKSVNGDSMESIESIRFRAPKHYQTQDRAITNSDYRNMVFENFPEIKAVNVYGGESLYDSVEYGRVFISAVSRSGATITNSLKTDIVNYLSDKNSISIKPVIIDPNFLYVIPSIITTVNFDQTNLSPADIKSLVLTAVQSFNTSYLQDFNTSMRFSKFLNALNNADPSIESIQVYNIIKKIASPTLNINSPVSTAFNNVIVPGTLISSEFLLNDGNTYILTDYNPNKNTFVRTGSNSTYDISNTNKVIYLKQITASNIQNYTEVGTIDYDNGSIISVKSLIISNFLGEVGISFYASPKYEDLHALKNDLIEIDIDNVSVSVVSS